MEVKIYNDVGVSKASVQHCLFSLRLYMPKSYSVGYISALEIIEGSGLGGTYLFMLPGGRDLSYYYGSHKGASFTRIIITYSKDEQDCYVYYNGGGYFVGAENMVDTTVIASYTYRKAAIIKCNYGLRTVILSGVHLEYDPCMMQKQSLKHIRNTSKHHNEQSIKLFKYILALLSIQ